MSYHEILKLEILGQFIKKYDAGINPSLMSVKYCQTPADAYLEMMFTSAPDKPTLLNLDFITGDEDPDAVEGFALLFNPEADVVDNASALVELDPYSLINCIDGLFTEEAANIINDNYQASLKQGK